MPHDSSAGRPRRSSRETLQDAAYELFLESGYEAATIDAIAARAGISRSTFWAYARSKTDLLWLDVDLALDRLATALAEKGERSTRSVVTAFAETIQPSDAPLPLLEVDTMAVAAQLRASAFDRTLRLVSLLETALADDSRDDPRADAWRMTGDIMAAGERWLAASRRGTLAEHLAFAV